MAIRLSCPRCHRLVAVPEEARVRKVNCLPPCGAEIPVPVPRVAEETHRPAVPGAAGAGGALSSPLLSEATVGTSCPTCQSAIGRGEATFTCPRCELVHHRECWEEIGGCSSYGCPEAPPPVKADMAVHATSAWGDTKTCPVCLETIPSAALRCEHCRMPFPTADPLTIDEIYATTERARLRTQVLTLFILSLFGCLSPLMLPLGLSLLNRRRPQLARAGQPYLTLVYLTIAVSIAFISLTMLALVYELYEGS